MYNRCSIRRLEISPMARKVVLNLDDSSCYFILLNAGVTELTTLFLFLLRNRPQLFDVNSSPHNLFLFLQDF